MKNSYEIIHEVSGQDWARKLVTFRLASAVPQNETGLLHDILRLLRV